MEDSGLAWTTLRATQFHESMLIVARQMAKMPVIAVLAGVRFQPIDGGEVATRLVELSFGKPSGLVSEAVNAVVAAAFGSTLPLLLYSSPGIRQPQDCI